MKKDQKTIFYKKKHIENLVNNDYYKNLIIIRNLIELSCDKYFQNLKAPKVDLYLITKSVSSPIAKGSDSKPISFNFEGNKFYLSDSSQFGMEPLVLNFFEIVYCYLPSFRGEEPNEYHLNQFFHCEAEMRGNYQKAIKIAEGLIKFLIKEILIAFEKKIFYFKKNNFKYMEYIINRDFPQITFDEAEKILKKKKLDYLIKRNKYGRIISRLGELKITEILTNNRNFVWIKNYDRDVVPFYQKPDPINPERVLNADLIMPKLKEEGFGGECIGLGQRQDNAEEIIESMKRQKIKNIDEYKWYINLRNHPKYRITSGFGLGIERFLTWILGLNSIYDVAIYPVIKNSHIIF